MVCFEPKLRPQPGVLPMSNTTVFLQVNARSGDVDPDAAGGHNDHHEQHRPHPRLTGQDGRRQVRPPTQQQQHPQQQATAAAR